MAALQLGVSILALPSEGDAAISAAAEAFAEKPGNHKHAAVALRLADELAQERVELTIAVAAIARSDPSRDARQRLAKEWAA